MNPIENLKRDLEKASADHAIKKIINNIADKINNQDEVISELNERLSDIEETENGP